EGPHSFHVRNLVALGEGASAAIVESFAGSGRYWTNAVNVTRAGRASRLTHVKVQDEGSEAVHFALHRVFLEERAQYQSFALTLGARLSRHESLVTIAGEGAECRLDGAYLLRGEQEATNATFVDHAAPGGVTTELFKGVVDDRAHGVFLGAITVRPEAQKTDARQMSRALILSPRAVVDTKPELDISADDVKCSHGATVGDLDQAALFYLASRGIPVGLARRMLIEAFANDAMAGVGEEALKALLHRHVQVWLERSGK
ncbi:MAG TPA: Fe-S cluster assembly protein SufD, partial [Stellaceae bacterium]|nr:Fe-S cluster assembly protein SufD [Stellaceae bacterium]